MEPTLTNNDIRAYLEGQPKEWLLDLLMEQVQEDERLHDRLLLRVAQVAAGGPNVSAYKRTLENAIVTGDYIEYREAWDYSMRVQEAISSVGELLSQGHAAIVRELAEFALEGLQAQMNQADDSGGYIGGAMHDAVDLHCRACTAERPDPETLARWLLNQQIEADWLFDDALTRYAEPLGEPGLAAYRRIARAAWEKLPPVTPGEKYGMGYGRRAIITRIMEMLARQSGDVEELLAIKGQDLSSASRFLDIAKLLLEHGRADEALSWAERGMAAFPTHPDAQLVAFLVEQYRLRERHEEALKLLWQQYQARPCLYNYQPLHKYTLPLGSWPEWRERAQELFRGRPTLAPARVGRWNRGPDHSELVEILLWEQEIDAAWEAAQNGGCSEHLWQELAAQREQEHPEDSLKVYRDRVEPLIEPITDGNYHQPVQLILKVGEILRRLGREPEFRDYVQQIRTTFRRKRNLLRDLDSLKL